MNHLLECKELYKEELGKIKYTYEDIHNGKLKIQVKTFEVLETNYEKRNKNIKQRRNITI